MDTDYDVVRGDLGRTRDATGSVHLMPCEIDAEGNFRLASPIPFQFAASVSQSLTD